MSGPGSWTFFPYFLLRATGFPVERMAGVAAFDGMADPGDAGRVADERRRLFEALGDPGAREALMTSAPLVDRNFDGWRAHAEAGRRNAQDKKRERVLWRFLQRLTAKNDSTSFFGAVAAGSFEVDFDAGTVLPVEAGRRAFSTQWLVEKLLSTAVEDLVAAGLWPGIERAFRRAPGADADGVVWEPGGRGFKRSGEPEVVGPDYLPSGLVDPVGAAVAVLRSAPESAEREAWIGRFMRLEEGRAAFEATAGKPDERRAMLAAHEAELTAMLGEAPSRHEGEFYASRTPLHEQADRTGTVIGFPKVWTAELQTVAGPFLELSLLNQLAERLTFAAWFERTWESSRDEPVLWREVLAEIAKDPMALELAAPAEARVIREALKGIKTELRAQVDRVIAAGEVEARLEVSAEVGRLLGGLGAKVGTAYANPDFMVAADPTAHETRFILAEAHHLPHLTGCLLPPLAACDEVVAASARFLEGLTAPAKAAFPVSWDHSFISVGVDLGAVGLELSGLAKEPPERRGTLAELAVYSRGASGEGLAFVVPSHMNEIADVPNVANVVDVANMIDVAPLTRTARLHQASPVYSVATLDLGSWLAGPDWRPVEALPRLSYGGLVVHRRRFVLKPDEVKSAGDVAGALARVSGLAVEHVPRFMFMRVESEPKPILIDWWSGISMALALWSLGRGETLTLSEMWPAPEQCWLRGPGGHYTSELRTVMVRRGGPPS